MPFFQKSNENQIRKVNTGADLERATPVLKDTIHEVTASEESSRIVNTGIFYNIGTHELEVTCGSNFYRTVSTVAGEQFGDYTEISSYEIQFESGIIHEGDVLRFRVTSNSYDRSENTNDIQQLAKDLYGRASATDLTNSDGISLAPKPVVAATYRIQTKGGSYLNDTAIQAAINDAAGDNLAVHLTRGVWTIDDSVVVPSNITLVVDDGAEITLDGTATLTINGIVMAGAYQIFFGANNLDATVSTYPRDDAWWGLTQRLQVYGFSSVTGGGSDGTTQVSIQDEDGDTWVTTDYGGTDEDKIRFTTGSVEAMIIDDSQRVGIGIDPVAGDTLVVSDTATGLRVTCAADSSVVTIEGDSDLDSAILKFRDVGSTSYWEFARVGTGHPVAADDLDITYWSPATGTTEFVTFDSSAEVITFKQDFNLQYGALINEFSIDGTLAGDSDNAVPTEQAVKTYVDTEIAALPTGADMTAYVDAEIDFVRADMITGSDMTAYVDAEIDNVMAYTDAAIDTVYSDMTAAIAASGVDWNAGELEANSSTPDVSSGATAFTMDNTSTNTITDFIGGVSGQVIILKFSDSHVILSTNANIKLQGGGAVSPDSGDTITLVNVGGVWYETSRSINS